MLKAVIPKITLRLRPIMYLLVFAVPLLPYWGLKMASSQEHYNIWAWWGIFVYHVAAPIIEQLIGKDCKDPTDEQVQTLEKRPYYKFLVIAIIPAQLILLLYGALTAAMVQGHEPPCFSLSSKARMWIFRIRIHQYENSR